MRKGTAAPRVAAMLLWCLLLVAASAESSRRAAAAAAAEAAAAAAQNSPALVAAAAAAAVEVDEPSDVCRLPQSFPESTVNALTELYGEPAGGFLYGRYGFTNYVDAGPKGARVAVLSHGLGTRLQVYDGAVVETLLMAGYRVIRYSFIGHGWSVPHAEQAYDRDMFVTQAQEVVDFLLNASEPVSLWVGHSTGCVVGVLFALSGSRRVEDLALISPAFWANKPLVARIADMVPDVLDWLTQFKVMQFLIEGAYTDNFKIALATRGGVYLRPKFYASGLEGIKRDFRLHPHIPRAILRTSSYFLRSDLLVEWQAALESLVGKHQGRIALLWGTQDIVVPFEHSRSVFAWNPKVVTVSELADLGHESIQEDPAAVAAALKEFVSP